MPLTQPKRDNPLMGRYFRLIGLPGKRLAERCGVSHSQVYMARTRNVGADNAEKISRGVASILALSERERLELKAEIMGHPDKLVRAYLGGPRKTARLLKIPRATAEEILDEEKSVAPRSGEWALSRLRVMGAPAFVIDSVERRMRPSLEPRRGLITHNLHGPEMVEQRKRTRESLGLGKPQVNETIQRSGLKIKDIHVRAGVGKETLRRALYGQNLSPRSARAIAEVLGKGLPQSRVRTLEEELKQPSRKTF